MERRSSRFSLNVDKSEPPVGSVIIHLARRQHELLHSLFNNVAEHETNPTIKNVCSETYNRRTKKADKLLDSIGGHSSSTLG